MNKSLILKWILAGCVGVAVFLVFNIQFENPTFSESTPKKQQTLIQQGRLCQVVSDPKNYCSVSYLLPYFNNDENLAKQASAICNLESAGDPAITSSVDYCRDGNTFSVGLFQINIIAKENLLPECTGIFKKTMNEAGDDVACLKKNDRGICTLYDCRVTDQAQYTICKAAVSDVAKNISIAYQVWQETNSWHDWGSYQFCRAEF